MLRIFQRGQNYALHVSNRCHTSNFAHNVDVPLKLLKLIQAFRLQGHFAANLDPLGADKWNDITSSRRDNPERRARWLPDNPQDDPTIVRLLLDYNKGTINMAEFELEGIPVDKEFYVADTKWRGRNSNWSIASLIKAMSNAYCGSVGVEFGHIEKEHQKQWLIKIIESEFGPNHWNTQSTDDRLRTLTRLMRSDHLEKFLGSKFPSAKRFGIEGCESLIPGLWAIVEAAVPLGLEGIEMGMAHRYRMLAHWCVPFRYTYTYFLPNVEVVLMFYTILSVNPCEPCVTNFQRRNYWRLAM